MKTNFDINSCTEIYISIWHCITDLDVG